MYGKTAYNNTNVVQLFPRILYWWELCALSCSFFIFFLKERGRKKPPSPCIDKEKVIRICNYLKEENKEKGNLVTQFGYFEILLRS